MIDYDDDDKFIEFDELESFFHDVGGCIVLLCGSYKDNFSITYLEDYDEFNSNYNSDHYLIRIDNYYLELRRGFIRFKSPKTKGWVVFYLDMKLESFIDIIKSPIDLELHPEIRNLNFDNIIFGEDIIIEYNIEKIRKKLHRFEPLRLFL